MRNAKCLKLHIFISIYLLNTGNLRSQVSTADINNELYDKIIKYGNVSALERLMDFPKLSVDYLREDGLCKLHFVKECIRYIYIQLKLIINYMYCVCVYKFTNIFVTFYRSYTLGFLIRKTSIYLNTINYYVGNFASAGLISKWTKDTMHSFELLRNLNNREIIAFKKHVTLTLNHLQYPFIFLTFGLITALLIFIIEIFCNINIKLKRKHVVNKKQIKY